MVIDDEDIARFTGPVGFEVYTGKVSDDQRSIAVRELDLLTGVGMVFTRANKTSRRFGYTLQVFVDDEADVRVVRQTVAKKMKELTEAWGTPPPPALIRH